MGYSYQIRVEDNKVLVEIALSARLGVKIIDYLRKRLNKSEELHDADISLNSEAGESDVHLYYEFK